MRLRTMIVALFVSMALLGAACGSDDDNGDDVASNGSGDATTTTAKSSGSTDPYLTPSGGSSSSSGTTVQVADDPKLGKFLVGPNGHTLYLFTKDTGTTTACTGGCAAAWPALTAASAPTGGPGVDASKLTTVAGQAPGHVAYNGHLLYYFAQDTAPGQTNGTAIANWFAVSPAGDQIGG
jgi:predicted lipoprotein with Yx(FWY)xxD motif